MFSKIFSTFMSVILMLQTLFPFFSGARNDKTFTQADLSSLHSVSDYVDYIRENGAPSMDTQTFFKNLKPVKFLRTLFGGTIFEKEEDKYLHVTMSDDLAEMCDLVTEASGFDLLGTMQHIPKTLGTLTALKRAVHPDLSAFRQKVFSLCDEVRAKGHTGAATLLYLFGVFFSVVDDMSIYTVEGENENELVVLMDVTYRDGTTETVDPDIVINTETNTAYAKQGFGVSGSGFEVDLDKLVVYTVVNSWQRNYGFYLGYDLSSDSNPVFNYNTRRFKFDYAGKAWMIQIWKGNYALVTNGAEVGVYNRAPGKIGTFYNAAADEDMLVMSMDVYHGDELIISRGPELQWWMTGFKLTKQLYVPSSLTLKFSIEMKDDDMLKAFTDAIEKEANHDVSYTVDGLTVYGTW